MGVKEAITVAEQKSEHFLSISSRVKEDDLKDLNLGS